MWGGRLGRPAKPKSSAIVEERRFNAAVRDQIREGFSPSGIDIFEICGSRKPEGGMPALRNVPRAPAHPTQVSAAARCREFPE